jgi:hypothetical protein
VLSNINTVPSVDSVKYVPSPPNSSELLVELDCTSELVPCSELVELDDDEDVDDDEADEDALEDVELVDDVDKAESELPSVLSEEADEQAKADERVNKAAKRQANVFIFLILFIFVLR